MTIPAVILIDTGMYRFNLSHSSVLYQAMYKKYHQVVNHLVCKGL